MEQTIQVIDTGMEIAIATTDTGEPKQAKKDTKESGRIVCKIE